VDNGNPHPCNGYSEDTVCQEGDGVVFPETVQYD
jgi:hypothetical protein